MIAPNIPLSDDELRRLLNPLPNPSPVPGEGTHSIIPTLTQAQAIERAVRLSPKAFYFIHRLVRDTHTTPGVTVYTAMTIEIVIGLN